MRPRQFRRISAAAQYLRIIAEKDAQIAQLNTTIDMLRGRLGERREMQTATEVALREARGSGQ